MDALKIHLEERRSPLQDVMNRPALDSEKS